MLTADARERRSTMEQEPESSTHYKRQRRPTRAKRFKAAVAVSTMPQAAKSLISKVRDPIVARIEKAERFFQQATEEIDKVQAAEMRALLLQQRTLLELADRGAALTEALATAAAAGTPAAWRRAQGDAKRFAQEAGGQAQLREVQQMVEAMARKGAQVFATRQEAEGGKSPARKQISTDAAPSVASGDSDGLRRRNTSDASASDDQAQSAHQAPAVLATLEELGAESYEDVIVGSGTSCDDASEEYDPGEVAEEEEEEEVSEVAQDEQQAEEQVGEQAPQPRASSASDLASRDTEEAPGAAGIIDSEHASAGDAAGQGAAESQVACQLQTDLVTGDGVDSNASAAGADLDPQISIEIITGEAPLEMGFNTGCHENSLSIAGPPRRPAPGTRIRSRVREVQGSGVAPRTMRMATRGAVGVRAGCEASRRLRQGRHARGEDSLGRGAVDHPPCTAHLRADLACRAVYDRDGAMVGSKKQEEEEVMTVSDSTMPEPPFSPSPSGDVSIPAVCSELVREAKEAFTRKCVENGIRRFWAMRPAEVRSAVASALDPLRAFLALHLPAHSRADLNAVLDCVEGGVEQITGLVQVPSRERRPEVGGGEHGQDLYAREAVLLRHLERLLAESLALVEEAAGDGGWRGSPWLASAPQWSTPPPPPSQWRGALQILARVAEAGPIGASPAGCIQATTRLCLALDALAAQQRLPDRVRQAWHEELQAVELMAAAVEEELPGPGGVMTHRARDAALSATQAGVVRAMRAETIQRLQDKAGEPFGPVPEGSDSLAATGRSWRTGSGRGGTAQTQRLGTAQTQRLDTAQTQRLGTAQTQRLDSGGSRARSGSAMRHAGAALTSGSGLVGCAPLRVPFTPRPAVHGDSFYGAMKNKPSRDLPWHLEICRRAGWDRAGLDRAVQTLLASPGGRSPGASPRDGSPAPLPGAQAVAAGNGSRVPLRAPSKTGWGATASGPCARAQQGGSLALTPRVPRPPVQQESFLSAREPRAPWRTVEGERHLPRYMVARGELTAYH